MKEIKYILGPIYILHNQKLRIKNINWLNKVFYMTESLVLGKYGLKNISTLWLLST